jgi:hypothetical protein
MEDNDNHSGDNNECFNINKHINNMAKINDKLMVALQLGFIVVMLYFIIRVLTIIITIAKWLI